MLRPIPCALLALLAATTAATATAHADAPPLVSYPAASTGIANVRTLAETAGKVWLAGDANAFDATLVSCIDEGTGQKCAPSYPITLRAGVAQTTPEGIAVAKDGAVWVANEGDEDNGDSTQGSVSRIAPADGSVTTFTGAVVAPHAIVTGADGDIWVANDDNSISRLNPSTGTPRAGSPLASGATSPGHTLFANALAVGQDGDVWATLADGNSSNHSRITRLDGATGAVKSGYPKPTGGDHTAGGLTIGADGDIWVGDDGSGQTSRLAPSTGLNRSGYPKFKTPATGMATGADGDVWLTGGNPATVDRVDPATGASRAGYPLAMPTTTSAITIAANGDPWVAVSQPNANRVVHVNLSGSTVTPPAAGGGGGGGGGPTTTTTAPVVPPVLAPPVVSPPAAAPDTTAPRVTLSGATRQKAGTSISVTVTCPTEACTARATAVLTVPRTSKAKTYKLAAPKHAIAAGRHATVRLTLTKTERVAVAKALRGHATRDGVKVAVTVTVADAAGNARRVTRTIRLTRTG